MPERYTFRVRWGDCDPADIVFYPRFIEYTNEAAHAFMEARGYSINHMRDVMKSEGVPMVALKCDFRAPMRTGDEGEIETKVTAMGRSSIKLAHIVRCRGQVVLELEETRVFSGRKADGTLGSLEIPEAMRRALTDGD